MRTPTMAHLAAVIVLAGTLLPSWAQEPGTHAGLTPNEVAGNGPLPGDVGLYARELAAAQKHASPGYYPSISGAELTDSQRSGLFASATFTGSFEGPNRVCGWRSEDSYQGATYINTRKPNELLVVGGDFPPPTGPMPPGVEKVAGIRIDQETGDLKLEWVIDVATTGFQPLIGPKDKRVILLSRMKRNVEGQPIQQTIFTGNFKEQVTWRDAATGRLIAESDFFEPMTVGSLITPGFGGRVYFPTDRGFITLQVMPAAAPR